MIYPDVVTAFIGGLAVGALLGVVGTMSWLAQDLKRQYDNITKHQQDIKHHYMEIGAQARMIAEARAASGIETRPPTLN